MEGLVCDETTDEVFISDTRSKRIQVYSSAGEFKRGLNIPVMPGIIVDFDDQSLFVYDEQLYNKKTKPGKTFAYSHSIDSSYLRISKADGKDKVLKPVIGKTPLANETDPQIVFFTLIDAGKYQFLQSMTVDKSLKNRTDAKYYGYDKQTGEIFTPVIRLPDYKGKSYSSTGSYHNSFAQYLGSVYPDLSELKQAYAENR
jgi:hypothetical protein